MPDPAYQQALITGYVNLTGNLQQQTLDYLLALYAQSPDYREATAAAFASQAAPVVAGVQDSMSTLTQAYLALLIADMTGEPIGSAGVAALNLAAGLRGVDPKTLYQRPFEQVWYALSQGVPFDEAVQRGSDRLRDIASTDVQLAKTHTSREVLSADERVVGYRRVLEGTYSCGLCVLASTQRYRKQNLMPIHPACDCGVIPIIGDHDPGQTINDQALVDVHTAIKERFGQSSASGRGVEIGDDPVDYKDLLITHEHGEIGPVLARRGDHFDGPSEVS